MKSRWISLILIILIFSTQPDCQELFTKAEEYLKTGQYLKAKEIFLKYIEDPKFVDKALLGVAKSDYFLGNYYEATLSLRRVLKDFPTSPCVNEANLYMGLSLLKIKRVHIAESYLKKVKPPFEKKAKIGIGWIAFYRGNLKEVEKTLNEFDKNDFNEPELALLRLKYLAYVGKADEAIKEFDKNYKLNKADYSLDKAEILIKAKRYSEAESILKRTISISKNNYDIIMAKKLLFDLYFEQGKPEALIIGKEIYTTVPSDEVKLKLFTLYLNQKNYDDAVKSLFAVRDRVTRERKIEEFLKTLMKESPDKANSYIMKSYPFISADSALLLECSQFLINQGKTEEAKILLKKIQTGPRKAEAIIPYAKILINEGKYAEAKKILEPLKNRNSVATGFYGLALYKEGKKTEALKYLKGVSKSVKDKEILRILGDLEYSQGQKNKAIQYWMEASKLSDSQATVKVADYFYLNKKTKEAIEFYKKALNQDIKDQNTLLWVYYQYGKLTKDKTYLEKVANSNSELSVAAKAILENL
ncbi:MAG: hypothetical protein ABDH16_00835 [Thermodesulfovibrionaceae bacterium]